MRHLAKELINACNVITLLILRMEKNCQHVHDVDEKYILRSQIKKYLKCAPSWKDFFSILSKNNWFWKIFPLIVSLDKNHLLIPHLEKIFQPFLQTKFTDLKVCIVGESPYNTNKLATGIAFSSGDPKYTPPTLKNIFRQLLLCFPDAIIETNSLDQWSKKGVFLYNFYFIKTIDHNQNKQLRKWCKKVTQQLILYLSTKKSNFVYLLLGNVAKQCKKWILSNKNSLCLTFSHPSPLSAYRNFHNSNCFTRVNDFINKPIDWNLKNDAND